MPAMPPSDEPALPKLRRFRFDPQDPKVAREVAEDGTVVADGPPAASTTPPDLVRTDLEAEREAADAAVTKPAGEQDLRESDQLLAELDGAGSRPTTTDTRRGASAGPRSHPSRQAHPSSQAHASPQVHASPQAHPSPRAHPSRESPIGPHTGPTRTASTSSASPTAAAPRTGPTSAASPPTGPTPSSAPTGPAATAKRSPWPFALAGVAAAVVIGLVAWFVLMPGDNTDEQQNAGGGSDSGITAWAVGVCGELAEFQTDAMPLRAEAAKTTASSGDSAVTDLRREASELLTSLATELQGVGIPSGSDAASTAHTTILSAVNAAATSAKSSGSSSVGTPEDAVTAILNALDRPVTIFQEAVAELPTADRDAITSEETCTPLL